MLMNYSVTTHEKRGLSVGFALPTVLLASTLMMAVLLLAVQANTAVRAELNSQFYNRQARLASQSGVARAQQCLKENGSVATWTDVKPLLPNTDCSGNIVGGYSSYVYTSSVLRTSFSVPAPVTTNGVQRVNANGKLELLRTSSNTAWRTYNQILVSQTGADVTFSNVTFGYAGTAGAFFGTIGINGEVKTLGYNGNGQLGTGDTVSDSAPRTFGVPVGVKVRQLFSNFLSVGYNMFALTTTGDVYGAGSNDHGQLGGGSASTNKTTPVKFKLPPGVQATYVAPLGWATFVLGDDNNIYSVGWCSSGLLGTNYTIAGCTDKSTYVRVNLPTPNTSDPNTIPVSVSTSVPSDNIAVDRLNVYVRMQGGSVYGWGIGDNGQLGIANSVASTSNPVKMGTFGDSGKPKATQVAFDGDTIYILDDTGTVYTAGRNSHTGALGGAASQLQHLGTSRCLNDQYNSTSSGTRATIYDCINAVSQRVEFTSDGYIIFRPTAGVELCLDNQSSNPTNGNPVQLYTCNGSNAQKWDIQDNGLIVNVGSGKCLDDYNNTQPNDSTLNIWACDPNSVAQQWSPANSTMLQPVPVPASAGKVTRIATDQWSTLFLTDLGEVWGAGSNDRGQLCNGTVGKNMNPKLTKAILPPGRTATFIYTTKSGGPGSIYANSYIVLDNGNVIGCGANTFGQLGNGVAIPSGDVGSPVLMNLPVGVIAKQVQTGTGTTVVLSTIGAIYTVGNNTNGQLGDGTTTSSSTPKANKYTNIIPATLF